MSYVWYAAYGSNTNRERFDCYISGGRAPGRRYTQRGCSDPTPPSGDRPVALPHDLYFAGHSHTWGGAPAFVNATVNADAGTLARAWRITIDQFLDVVAQECGRRSLTVEDRHDATIELDIAFTDGAATVIDGLYGHVLSVGELDGLPVVTCTTPWPHRLHRCPTGAYLQTIADGIKDSHGIGDTAVSTYLSRRIPTRPRPRRRPRRRHVDQLELLWCTSCGNTVDIGDIWCPTCHAEPLDHIERSLGAIR